MTSCSITEHPSRPFLDQTLCEQSGRLVGRAAKYAPRCNTQMVYCNWCRPLQTCNTRPSSSRTFLISGCDWMYLAPLMTTIIIVMAGQLSCQMQHNRFSPASPADGTAVELRLHSKNTWYWFVTPAWNQRSTTSLCYLLDDKSLKIWTVISNQTISLPKQNHTHQGSN